jgi:hypothetical protein
MSVLLSSLFNIENGIDEFKEPPGAEEQGLLERLKSLEDVVSESRDVMSSAHTRLQVLSRRKAAAALEGITQEQMDEFRSFRLIRVPAPSPATVICSICTLLSLEGDSAHQGTDGARKKAKLLSWNEARQQLGRPDLLRALVNFDALTLLDFPEVLSQLRRLVHTDRSIRTVGIQEISARNRWKAAVANVRAHGDAKGPLNIRDAWSEVASKGELSPVTLEAALR